MVRFSVLHRISRVLICFNAPRFLSKCAASSSWHKSRVDERWINLGHIEDKYDSVLRMRYLSATIATSMRFLAVADG